MEPIIKIYNLSDFRKKQNLKKESVKQSEISGIDESAKQSEISDHKLDINDLAVDERCVLRYYRQSTHKGKEMMFEAITDIWFENRKTE